MCEQDTLAYDLRISVICFSLIWLTSWLAFARARQRALISNRFEYEAMKKLHNPINYSS